MDINHLANFISRQTPLKNTHRSALYIYVYISIINIMCRLRLLKLCTRAVVNAARATNSCVNIRESESMGTHKKYKSLSLFQICLQMCVCGGGVGRLKEEVCMCTRSDIHDNNNFHLITRFMRGKLSFPLPSYTRGVTQVRDM